MSDTLFLVSVSEQIRPRRSRGGEGIEEVDFLPLSYLDLSTSLFYYSDCLCAGLKKNQSKAQSQFSWTQERGAMCACEHIHTARQGYRERSCLSLPLVTPCRSDLVSKLQAQLHVNHPGTSCSAFT